MNAAAQTLAPPMRHADALYTPPDKELMQRVPQTFRSGGMAPHTEARRYSDMLGPRGVTTKDVQGCYKFSGCGCCWPDGRLL